MRRLRIYVDTSVFGGTADEEFREPSRRLFGRVAAGEFTVLLSDETQRELAKAPEPVKRAWLDVPGDAAEAVEVSDEALALARSYVDAGVLSPTCLSDAIHVATATIADADVIVSWNFRHIVNYRRIQLFNAENMRQGYPTIDIRSPLELTSVPEDEDI